MTTSSGLALSRISNTHLTREQLSAVTSRNSRLYIEASPGSGKTAVAAERFGTLRYTTQPDTRAVVALSFTRAAVAELKQRIKHRWGGTALAWPHRVDTFDAFLRDLVTHLLRRGLLQWPGGHQVLTVSDKWEIWGIKINPKKPIYPYLTITNGRVSYRETSIFAEALADGHCTHEEVRALITAILEEGALSRAIADYMLDAVRALVVDEVFDGNELDLQIIRLACNLGIPVTLIGDPWQALYAFRGATPAEVPKLIADFGFLSHSLTRSFRFRSAATQSLSAAMRSGIPANVSFMEPEQQVDVILASRWDDLWETGPHVLPLSFGQPTTNGMAAATLLLNHITRKVLNTSAVYVHEALNRLGLAPETNLSDAMDQALSVLQRPNEATEAASEEMIAILRRSNARLRLQRPHLAAYIERIRLRTAADALSYIPGLTVHQAKGQEWNVVGYKAAEDDHRALANGLRNNVNAHRRLYVALTRARYATVLVP
ncbi:UvrD-helicase domain-containing protein [Nonomuraea sp. NPDC050451]|uniref:UvrD-helicase domain-containing protein n=1 Tax=Nonomuraea sp. NPDC050451 TaxID=3364364 RepID=UPI0037A06735